jgi:preprotein translocase subunit SecG
MLKLIGVFISLALILIIFFRIPDENVGLSSFATKSSLLGSPRSAQRFLNILTGVGIFVYLGIAFQLNLLNG